MDSNILVDSGPVITRLIPKVRDYRSEYLYEFNQLGTTVIVRIVRSRRKSMGLHLEIGELPELRVPTNCSWNEIHAFLNNKFDWIVATREKLECLVLAPINNYEIGGEVRYLGCQLMLVLDKSRFNVVEIDNKDKKIFISCLNPFSPKSVEKQVVCWYRKQAEMMLPKRVKVLNRLFRDRVDPTQVKVRKMSRSWGNCSTKGEVCLNILLMKEPWRQIDFVIAHELCHLRHFSHDKDFYALLNEVMPDWKEREILLTG